MNEQELLDNLKQKKEACGGGSTDRQFEGIQRDCSSSQVRELKPW